MCDNAPMSNLYSPEMTDLARAVDSGDIRDAAAARAVCLSELAEVEAKEAYDAARREAFFDSVWAR